MATIDEAIAAAQLGSAVNHWTYVAAQAATRIAAQRGLDPGRFVPVFLRLIDQESGFNPNAYNPSGASGIGQIMPFHNVDAFNPDVALPWAANYLADNIGYFSGDYTKGVAAYNAGPGNVETGAWLGFAETQTYVRNILGGGALPGNAGQPGYAVPTGYEGSYGDSESYDSYQYTPQRSGYKELGYTQRETKKADPMETLRNIFADQEAQAAAGRERQASFASYISEQGQRAREKLSGATYA